jgi:hypothetical protein
MKKEKNEHKRGAGVGIVDNSSLLGFCQDREREREMVKVVERKKNEKRGQPPLSDLGDSPLDEKQQRKRMCCASVPALLRRSRRVNPNPDADKIRHSKPEKRVEIHPKKEDKQVSGSDFYNDMLTWNLMTAEEEFFYTEHVLKSDVSKINSFCLLRTPIYIYIYTHIRLSLVRCLLF